MFCYFSSVQFYLFALYATLSSKCQRRHHTLPEVLSLLLTDVACCCDEVDVLVAGVPVLVGVGGSSSSGVNVSVLAAAR